MKFIDLLAKKELLKVIEENKYENPTQIQEEIIPLILEGYDVLGQSQTGTGKTLAFGAPILEKMIENKKVQSLILAPTRELAIQIAREIENLSKYMNISITCVYGSSSIEDQIKKLKKGSEIVVGTPGRVKDLLKRKVLKIDSIKYFILDEADEMLSMGFQEEIEEIFEKVKGDKQVLLFSATVPNTILTIAKKYMNKNYKQISVVQEIKTADHIKQNYYLVDDNTRIEAMCRIMDYYNPKKAIIFCRTKKNANDVLEKLSNKKYSVDVIHGDITQGQRIATLDRFKSGLFNYLIATDVAARGIHVNDVELVINYNLPESHEAYVHRIGRTGRVEKSGIAVSFIRKREEAILNSLEKYIKTPITKEELPTLNEIIKTRVEIEKEQLDKLKLCTSKLDIFDNYLDSLKPDEIKNILKVLLEKEIQNNLGSNFDIDTEVKEKKRTQKRDNGDSVRIFLTIGKMDKIEKREFLKYIEKTCKISEGTCFNVEIMPKFTFMNVMKDKYDKVYSSLNNTKYNNRLIRIEKAKK